MDQFTQITINSSQKYFDDIDKFGSINSINYKKNVIYLEFLSVIIFKKIIVKTL